jgi:hypothetical protein
VISYDSSGKMQLFSLAANGLVTFKVARKMNVAFLAYPSFKNRLPYGMHCDTNNSTSKGTEAMTNDELQDLIAKYKAGYEEVIDSLKDFPASSLAAHPIPGKWSAREIVHHLGDSETVSGIRLRRLLSEDAPVIQGYDQDEYAVRLKYNERDMEPSLEAFRAARATTAQIMEGMTPEDWNRAGSHNEHGRYSAEDWLRIYAAHAHNHAAQIRALRVALKS